jgi:hypothetical protein
VLAVTARPIAEAAARCRTLPVALEAPAADDGPGVDIFEELTGED